MLFCMRAPASCQRSAYPVRRATHWVNSVHTGSLKDWDRDRVHLAQFAVSDSDLYVCWSENALYSALSQDLAEDEYYRTKIVPKVTGRVTIAIHGRRRRFVAASCRRIHD